MKLLFQMNFCKEQPVHAQIQDAITVPPTPSTRPLLQLQD
jgi:hypothetical protein